MAERKSLSKKVRFEVFKRDNFTCQYCGSKAPDVILEVDYINPVINGGDNSIMNLITSCFSCNRGKSKNKLNDNSIVEKQRIQIEELNIRRQQLEMMLKWRDGEIKLKSIESDKAISYYNSLWEKTELSESGEKSMVKFVKKYGLIEVLKNLDECNEKYNADNNDKNAVIVFEKLGAFLNVSSKPEYMKKISYIKGILRNKFYINEYAITELLLSYYNAGYDLDDLILKLKSDYFKNINSFISFIK